MKPDLARVPYSRCTNRMRIRDGARIPCCIANKSWCRCDHEQRSLNAHEEQIAENANCSGERS